MKPLNILIFENETHNAVKLEVMIQTIGYQVQDKINDLSKTLHYIRDKQPDLMVVQLPLKHLPQVRTLIKQTKKNTPILLIANSAEKGKWQDLTNSFAIPLIEEPTKRGMLRAAIELAIQQQLMSSPTTHAFSREKDIYLKNNGVYYRISISDILFIKSANNHVIIYTKDASFIQQSRLSDMQQLVQNHLFLQTHRSCLVNLKKISSIDTNENKITVGKVVLPISRRMKPNLIKAIC